MTYKSEELDPKKLDELDELVFVMSTNLEHNMNPARALRKIQESGAPYHLMKKYNVKELASRYSIDPETSTLAKSLKHTIRRLKKEKDGKKHSKKSSNNESNPGIAPKMEQQNLDDWMDSEGEEEATEVVPEAEETVKYAPRLEDLIPSKKDKKKSDKDRKRSKHHDEEDFQQSSSKKFRGSSPMKINFIDILPQEDTKKSKKDKHEREYKEKRSSKGDSSNSSSSTTSPIPESIEAVNKELPKVVRKSPTPPNMKKPAAEIVKPFNEEDMFRPRKDGVRKVFAGRQKKKPELSGMFSYTSTYLINANPALLRMELAVVDFEKIRPALSHCNVEQLRTFIANNPMHASNADKMFIPMIEKNFPRSVHLMNKKTLNSDLYVSLVEDREIEDNKKLERLTTQITSNTKAADTGRRTQMISEAHTPKNIRQRQAKYGLAHTMKATPSAQELSQARKAVGNGNTKKLAAMPSAVVNRNSRVGASTGQKKKPPPPRTAADLNVGHLMKKTMKMLNIKRR